MQNRNIGYLVSTAYFHLHKDSIFTPYYNVVDNVKGHDDTPPPPPAAIVSQQTPAIEHAWRGKYCHYGIILPTLHRLRGRRPGESGYLLIVHPENLHQCCCLM